MRNNISLACCLTRVGHTFVWKSSLIHTGWTYILIWIIILKRFWCIVAILQRNFFYLLLKRHQTPDPHEKIHTKKKPIYNFWSTTDWDFVFLTLGCQIYILCLGIKEYAASAKDFTGIHIYYQPSFYNTWKYNPLKWYQI